MSYSYYLCLLAHSGVQLILGCVFVLFFFVLGIIFCQFLCVFLRLGYHILPVSLCFSSSWVSYFASFSVFFFVLGIIFCQFLCVFLRLGYHILPVSLSFPFLIVPSVFSNVHLSYFIAVIKVYMYIYIYICVCGRVV
jgi:hypothetical protein